MAAVANYKDLPDTTRWKLQSKMMIREYDDIAEITRDNIKGKSEYTDLRSMHFGANRLCTTVTRDKWSSTAVERGLVYCADGQCIIVPTVCGNVSRVTRVAKTTTPPAGTPVTSDGVAVGNSQAAPLPLILPVTPVPSLVTSPVATFENSSSSGGYTWWSGGGPTFGMGGGSGGGGYFIQIPAETPPAPEPSTWLMLLAGGLALYLKRRR